MIYAAQAFQIEEIPFGIKITAPTKRIESRADALDTPVITTLITSAGENILSVCSYHYQGYQRKDPRFPKCLKSIQTKVEDFENETVLTSGRFRVHVDKKEWNLSFEADGRHLTSCGYHGLGYAQYDREPATMFPEQEYMKAEYRPYMTASLSLNPGACVYGLGERFTAFVKNGQVVDCWNEDGGTSSQIAYKNIPFYMTNQGYGVFADHADPVSFEVASEKVEEVGFSVPGEEIRYYLICGKDMKEILEGYTGITGRAALPPAWSFGLWLSTSFTTDYDEETANSFLKGMKDCGVPVRVFHFDCYWMRALHWCDFVWDPETFPDVPAMLKRYKNQGLKICVWINPYVAQGTKLFQEGMERGYFLQRADGRGVKQLDNWQPGMGLVDFTNPDAAAWYADQLKGLLQLGVDCFKTDFGERIPIDVRYADGSDPMAMHNYYTYLYNRCVYKLLVKEKGEQEAVLFARSATAGCQQFPVHWGGDCCATYASMAETLRGGLSFMMSGFSFWSHDMGGFEMTSSPDLYKRWVQFGLLSTHSRLHGSKSYRVPWLYDQEACEVCREFTQLKYSLMPYLYDCAAYAHETGIPVMRPMVLEFEEDPATAYLDMQYMLGNKLLVAPIFRENQQALYYLPEGTWTHLLSNERKNGGRWYQETYDFHSLPLYVRPNSILPIGGRIDRPDYSYLEGLSLHFYQIENEKSACCRITDTDGKSVFFVQAVYHAGCLKITMSELLKDLRLIIHGIAGPKEQICLVPEEKEVTVRCTFL